MRITFILLSLFAYSQAQAQLAARFPESFHKEVQIIKKADELPARLVRLQNNAVTDDTCQADWGSWVESVGAFTWQVDSYTRMFVVPCAMWSQNLSWRVFIEYNEPQADGRGLFRTVQFAVFHGDRTWQGRSEIYFWTWDPDTLTLKSMYWFAPDASCGTVHSFQYSRGRLSFRTESVLVNFNCAPNATWQTMTLPYP